MSEVKIVTRKQSISQHAIRAAKSKDPNKIDICFATGFKGLQYDPAIGTFYEILEVSEKACDLSRFKLNTCPFLAQHENSVWVVLGVLEDPYIEDGKGWVTVRFSSRPELQGLIQDVKDGILPNVSVGYDPIEYTDISLPGDSIRTLVATKWLPLEVSSVAIGFDPNSTTKRSNQTSTEVTIITKDGESTMTEAEKLAKEASDKAAKEQRDKEISDAKTQGAKDYAERCKKIRSQVTNAKLPAEFAQSLIDKDLTTEQAADEIFAELEKRSKEQKTTVTTTVETQMTTREQAIAALLYRANPTLYRIADKKENPLKGASFMRILESVIPRKADESNNDYAKRAIVTADLDDLLSNVANKVLADAFVLAQPTYKKFCSAGKLADFKDTPIIELSLYGLKTKVEGEDYDTATVTDGKETVALRERGVRFVISQKAIINDDLSALEQLPSKASYAGHSDIEKAVYDILNTNPVMGSDGKALFHADHKNLNAAGAEPSVDSVALAKAEMATQTTPDGEVMDLQPKYLIVPPKYELAARKVATAIVASSSADVNPFGGTLEVIVSARITGNKWFLACDPAVAAAIKTVTLVGVDEPKVSTNEEFKSSNFEFKVEFPNNAKAINYKAIYRVDVV